ncbi:I78 family peptidase inhibitor [Aurantiacibacter marinus]|uniref:Peptidase inhibitor I78 n=1 Tax=Aurantiacibacter marinus TaxID=874156 RepID=A0A0H0XK69_9SPHN|nr:I78 family peptidase inhibitor [Aurantiacibacter marinus]KLI62998.1 hypothetical protein AAV99_13270 [Aurantiacibacter marinus]
MRYALLTSIGSLALAGCVATTQPALGERPVREADRQCDASGVQDFIGRSATAQAGAQLLAATGSATLRWGPPRSAMTMDYRTDRVTIAYDDDLVIRRIVCG